MRSVSFHLAAVVVLAASAVLFTGCGKHSPVAPTTATGASLARMARPGLGTASVRHFEGSTGPGSTYLLDVPENWNHELVVYVHGIILPASLPIAPPNYGAIRDSLLGRGFAVAASTFDVNGYAVKDGAIRTFQLNGLFASKFGTPARTYLLGRSLGGLIAEDLVETHPEQYAGVLSASGPLCGSRSEMQYVGDVRVLFDCFFPGVLPGDVCFVPEMSQTDFMTQLAPQIVNALATHPDTLQMIVALMGGRLPGSNGPEYVQSIVLALAFQILGASNVFELTHDHCPYDNSDVVYSSPYIPQPILDAINACVKRYVATPDAVEYLRHYYEPTGELLKPMIALHTSRDPQVPAFHLSCYQSLVNEKGHGDNLRVHVVTRYGHDAWATSELVSYFMELVTWVEGSQPQP